MIKARVFFVKAEVSLRGELKGKLACKLLP